MCKLSLIASFLFFILLNNTCIFIHMYIFANHLKFFLERGEKWRIEKQEFPLKMANVKRIVNSPPPTNIPNG